MQCIHYYRRIWPGKRERERERSVCAVHTWKDNITLHHCYVIWSFGYYTNIVFTWRSFERSFSFLWFFFSSLFYSYIHAHIYVLKFFNIFMGIQWTRDGMVCWMKSSILSFNLIMWCATIATNKVEEKKKKWRNGYETRMFSAFLVTLLLGVYTTNRLWHLKLPF